MYADYLTACGFSPVQVGDTREALRIAWSVDVVVTGMRVPGPFDGLDLIRHLRADHRTADKPLIVLTASAFEADQRRAYEAGCDRFLAKPCLPDLLGGEIRRLLTAPRSAA
jgi:two-component system, cell cycle response regulator DivK